MSPVDRALFSFYLLCLGGQRTLVSVTVNVSVLASWLIFNCSPLAKHYETRKKRHKTMTHQAKTVLVETNKQSTYQPVSDIHQQLLSNTCGAAIVSKQSGRIVERCLASFLPLYISWLASIMPLCQIASQLQARNRHTPLSFLCSLLLFYYFPQIFDLYCYNRKSGRPQLIFSGFIFTVIVFFRLLLPSKKKMQG